MKKQKQFAPNPVIEESAEKVFERLWNYERGDVVSWADLEEFSGLIKYGKHWDTMLKKVRARILRERGIFMFPVPFVGLKLLTHEEHLTVRTAYRRRKAYRQISRDLHELTALPDEELSERQRLDKLGKIEQAEVTLKQNRLAARLAEQLTRPKEA